MSRCTTRPLVRLALVLATAASAAASELPTCPPISGTEELFQVGTILLVGEQHGTEESPAFVGRLACHAVAVGLPLIVGIEIFDSEQARFDAFLASSGDAASRAALLAGAPWRQQPQYGVTSEAMVGLLEELRRLRQGGESIRIVLFNRSAPDSPSRDRKMAEYLGAALAGTDAALTLVLTGNIHSRLSLGTRWDPECEPMGYLLRQAVAPRRLLSLDVAHGGGTAWMDAEGTVGVRKMGARGPVGEGVTWTGSAAKTGHDGWYHVGEINASPFAAHGVPEGEDGAPAVDIGGHEPERRTLRSSGSR